MAGGGGFGQTSSAAPSTFNNAGAFGAQGQQAQQPAFGGGVAVLVLKRVHHLAGQELLGKRLHRRHHRLVPLRVGGVVASTWEKLEEGENKEEESKAVIIRNRESPTTKYDTTIF